MFGIFQRDKSRKKRVYWGYSVLDYKGMEAYFEKMAKEGWMLEKIGEVWATFYEASPKNLQFTIDVFEDSGILTPEETDEAKEYRELCEKNGWHFVTSIKALQIFYAHAEEDLTPLQTDEQLEENLAKKKLWKMDFGANIMVLLLILGVVIFSRLNSPVYMDDYTGNIIYFLYPYMLIPAAISLIRTMLWIRKVNRQGLPDKEVQTFFSGRNRKLLIDGTWILMLGLLVIGVVLDSVYNPDSNKLLSIFPAVLGVSIGTILRLLLRKKGRKKSDGILFLIVGILVAFMILGVVQYIANQWFAWNAKEIDSNVIEEIPEEMESYSLDSILFSTEEMQLKGRSFSMIGQSFAIPKYYSQHERWEGDEDEWEFTVKTYEARNKDIAEIITEGYLNFELGGILIHLGDNWSERVDLKEAWDVDGFYIAEGYPAILMHKGDRVWIIEGPNINTSSVYREFEAGLRDEEEHMSAMEEINQQITAKRREAVDSIKTIDVNLLIEELLQ